jgi:GxxExxY protein
MINMDFKRYKAIVYQVIGIAMEVQKELNWGLLEPIYNEAMHLELMDKGIDHEIQKNIPCYYKGQKMEKHYQVDLLVQDSIIVELKSANKLIAAHRAQLFNYMRLTKKPIGLLINFGQPKLQGERYGLNPITNECVLLDKDMNELYLDDENQETDE